MDEQSETNPNQGPPKPEPAPGKIVWGTSMERNEGRVHVCDKPAPEATQKS